MQGDSGALQASCWQTVLDSTAPALPSDLLLALSSVGGLRLNPPSANKAAHKRSRNTLEEDERQPGPVTLSKSQPELSSGRSKVGSTDYPMRPLPSAIANHHRRLSRGVGGADDTTLSVMSPPIEGAGIGASNTAPFATDNAMQTPEQPGPFTFPFYSNELSRPFFQFNPQEDPSPPPSGPHDLEAVLQQMDDSEFEALFAIRGQPSSNFDTPGVGQTAGGGAGHASGSGYGFEQIQPLSGAQGRPIASGLFGDASVSSGGVPSAGDRVNPFLTAGGDMSTHDTAPRPNQRKSSLFQKPGM